MGPLRLKAHIFCIHLQNTLNYDFDTLQRRFILNTPGNSNFITFIRLAEVNSDNAFNECYKESFSNQYKMFTRNSLNKWPIKIAAVGILKTEKDRGCPQFA